METVPPIEELRRQLPSDQDASGRDLGADEIAAVTAAILTGTLTSTKGEFVKMLETRFAAMIGAKHAYACSSGTAALHCAVAALDLEPGDEVVTTPITDMGALAPIVYQGAIPVFADVDPMTCNVTAGTITDALSERTRAIVVTHLFGNPCAMDGIMSLAQARGIPVIEDCAQAFLAEYGGRCVGTLGTIGCFSLQQGKHITTGEGGLVVTDDDALARRIYLFINKAWGYGDPNPDHYFLALNYRMSELCGSVGAAQLGKLQHAVERRRRLAAELTALLAPLDEIMTPVIYPRAEHVYWKYCIRLQDTIGVGALLDLARVLAGRGITTVPRYIQKPAFMCRVFQDQRTFGTSRFPFTLARPEAVDYSRDRYPGAFAALERLLVFPWNDRYTGEDVAYIARGVHDAVRALPKETTA
jgi:dTDP-4-amino-4,6-dideoxygalactose transaminase